MKTIKEAQENAAKIGKDIDKKFNRTSTPLVIMVDLIEEVGELAEVIRAKEFYKSEPKEDLPSELADIIYDIFNQNSPLIHEPDGGSI